MGKTHLSRRELVKQDEFLVGVTGTWEYLHEHTREIIIGVSTIVVVLVAALGISWYMRHRQGVSNEEISNALQIFNSPLITDRQGVPLGPNQRVFATAQEKYTRAEEEFSRLSRKYSGLIGETATYYDGLCKFHLGDVAGAIRQLETITKSPRQGDMASLARLALAEIYGTQKNTAQLTALLQQLIDHPTASVPKVTAMMALADYYREINDRKNAYQLYKRIQTDFPSFQIQSEVRERLTELGATD